MSNTKAKKVRVTNYDFKDVDNLIVKVKKDGETLKVKIHSVAVCILKHWHDNPKDGQLSADKMSMLMEASGYHASALAKWVQLMTPMKLSEETGKLYVHAEDKLMGKQFIQSRDNPFWTVSPPSKPKPLDDLEELMKLRDRILKRQGEKAVEGDVIHLDMWRKITTIIQEAEAVSKAG